MPGTGAGDADLACRVSLNKERAERLRQLGQGSSMPVPEDDFATLVDAEWRLLTIDGDAILDETQPTLQFAPDDRRVAGNATANRFMGSFVRTGSGLAFGPLATTMMLREHPEGAMEQERRYLSVLGEIDAFKLADKWLELLQDGRVRLVFAPTPADEG
ncbi:MAG: META domain-containing protein [Geminicoccaceae bacterium]